MGLRTTMAGERPGRHVSASSSASLRPRPGMVLRHILLRPILVDVAPGRGIVLDVGGREGAIPRGAFGEKAPLLVCDIDHTALRTASRESGAIRVCGDARYLPLKPGVASVVLCLDVIEHIADDRSVLQELARVTAAGGVLVLSTPAAGFWLPLTRRSTVNRRWGHVRNGYEVEQLLHLLTSSGFVVERRGAYHGILTRLAYSLLFSWHLEYLIGFVAMALFKVCCRVERVVTFRAQEHWVVARRA
jgi:SAM-dependent methyltransferase